MTEIKTLKSKSVNSSEILAPAKPARTKPNSTAPAPCPPRKEQLLNMLERESGASSAEMIAVTGWLRDTLLPLDWNEQRKMLGFA